MLNGKGPRKYKMSDRKKTSLHKKSHSKLPAKCPYGNETSLCLPISERTIPFFASHEASVLLKLTKFVSGLARSASSAFRQVKSRERDSPYRRGRSARRKTMLYAAVRERLLWVKARNTRSEQMFSAPHRIAAIHNGTAAVVIWNTSSPSSKEANK